LLLDHWVAKPKPNNPEALVFGGELLQAHQCLYFVNGSVKFLVMNLAAFGVPSTGR
jgi:hypothetical protein